jgi:predicted TIM-barrel enzyme
MRWAAKSTNARGYGAVHQAVREQFKALVASGLAVCARCGGPFSPGAQFDLDHADDRGGYLGVSHSRCNRAAGARRGAAVASGRRVSRVW